MRSSGADAGRFAGVAMVRDRGARLWIIAVAVLLAVLFGEALAAIAEHWAMPEYSHGWLIPLVSGFVLWHRRRPILAARSEGSWSGVILVAAGLALLSLRGVAHMQVPPAVGFVAALAGLGLAALGPAAMRYAWLPLAFLLFALPVPATVYVILSTKLQLISSQLGAGLLDQLGVSVFLAGNVIDLGVYKLQVAEACSGLRYLFPLASFGFLCAWLYRAPLWARTAVFLSVVPITVLMNSVRIALTGLLVEYGSVELAEGFLHLFEGWAIFLVALALLFALMALLARLADRGARLPDLLDFDRVAGGDARDATGGPRPSRPGAPFAACLGLLLAAPPALAWFDDRPEVIPQRPGLVTFPLELGEWRGRMLPVARETLGVLGADDYLLADFTAPGARAPVNLWVAYYGSQSDFLGTQIHSPRACLPGSGWEFVSFATVPARPGGDLAPFQVNQAVVGRGGERMLIYYWYEQRGRRLAEAFWTKLYLLVDALAMHRSDGALVRLMTPLLPGETVEEAGGRLRAFLGEVYPHLEPHVGA